MAWSVYSVRGLHRMALSTQNLVFRAAYGSHFGSDPRIYGWPIIQLHRGSTLRFGHRARVYSHSFFNAIGVNHECVLRTLSPEARIIAGTDVGMSGCSICAVRAITIGDRVLLGANVAIIDSDLHVLPHLGEVSPGSSDGALDTLAAPVVIGNDVFIGMNSVVLKGVTIGSNSVIGAGSIVVDDVPPWSLVGGVPARVLRVLDKTDDGAAGEES